MNEMILTSTIIIITLGIIFAVKIFLHSKSHINVRPKAELTIQYGNDPCFEIRFQKLISSRLFRDFDIHLSVLDSENTAQSRQWLESLSRKTDTHFDIIN